MIPVSSSVSPLVSPSVSSSPYPASSLGFSASSQIDIRVAAECMSTRPQLLQSLLQDMGFAHLSVFKVWLYEGRMVPGAITSAVDQGDWLREYVDAKYFEVDVRLIDMLRTGLHCVWDLEQLGRTTQARFPDNRGRAFLHALRGTGLRSGVMFCLHDRQDMSSSIIHLPSTQWGRAWITDAVFGQAAALALCVHQQYQGAPPPVASATKPSVSALHHDMLHCLSLGMHDKVIADQLQISPHTLDRHLRQLRRQFGARNRVQLVQAAQRAGVLHL